MVGTARGRDELEFLPLGGAGEIGMNVNLYRHAGKWLMVDLGITFADRDVPGIDIVLPDLSYIEKQRSALVGLVLTHGHEDHLGAVQYLWPRLRCRVYATPFAAALLRRKIADDPVEGLDDLEVTEVALGARFDVGPFAIELVSLTHSIPEPNAVVIRTAAGTVMHTGDWKIDPTPLVGATTDEAALKRLGDEGVLAMVCDSTNALRAGVSGSEAEVRASLVELVRGRTGRVAIATFASNVARLVTAHHVAVACGRTAVLVGRSLWRIHDAARETGYLPREVRFLRDKESVDLPADKVLYVCTGCQGEPNAQLARIAAGAHPHVALGAEDMVILSSKIIPGNERPIYAMINQLVARDVEVITEADRFVHVSGHPSRDELTRMYQWVRPGIAVPVHGEARHMRSHAALARALQVPEAIVVHNGALVRLAPGPAAVIDHVHAGRLAWDGGAIVPMDGTVVRDRRRLMRDGAAFVTLVVDDQGELLTDPKIATVGLFEDGAGDDLLMDAADDVRQALDRLSRRDRRDDDMVSEAARQAVRRILRIERDKRPVVEVSVARV
ncbi:MAG: ribonuclease J [Alphaproteobacteria bacterium]|nr:ribonuclease J [Alphaproteobacteria bacterium]